MQNDLISRSALLHGVDKTIAHMREMAGADKLLNSAINLVQNARDFIARQTAVDAVEVVRCKDCERWSRFVGVVDSPNGYCFCHSTETNGFDFCSYGERRADDGK